MIALNIFLTFVFLFAIWLIVWNMYDGLSFFSKRWKTMSKSDKISIINISIFSIFLFVALIGGIVAVWLFI